MPAAQRNDSWDSEHNEDIPLDGGIVEHSEHDAKLRLRIKEQDPCWEDA